MVPMALSIRIECTLISVRDDFGNRSELASNVKRVDRTAPKIQMSVLFCTARNAATRRPSGESSGPISPFSSGGVQFCARAQCHWEWRRLHTMSSPQFLLK